MKFIKTDTVDDFYKISSNIKTLNNIFIFIECEKKPIGLSKFSILTKFDDLFINSKFYKILLNVPFEDVNIYIFDNNDTLNIGDKSVQWQDRIGRCNDYAKKNLTVYYIFLKESNF